MPVLRKKGLSAVTQTGGGGGGRKAETFTPLLTMKADDEKFLLIITPADEIEEVWLHKFVKVPSEREGWDTSYEVFASRTRNPEFGDEESFIEKELRHEPQKRVAAIAVELEPVFEGGKALRNIDHFNVIGKYGSQPNNDGEIPFFVSWRLLHEPVTTFWAEAQFLHDEYDTINLPIRVKRGDKGAYNFKELQVPVYLNDEEVSVEDLSEQVPSIEDEIKRLGSKERFDYYFGGQREIITRQGQKYQSEWWLKEMGFNSDSSEDEEEAPKKKIAPKTKRAKPAQRKVSVDDLDELVGIEEEEDEGDEEAPY